jgi:hypothetical protein
MKKIIPLLLIACSSQALAEITIEGYPKVLEGSWLEKAAQDATELSFHNSPQTIQIKSNGCVATGSYELQIAVEIPEKSSCWKYECFQMDITIKETQGGGECSAQYPVNQHLFMNMRLQDEQTLLFGEGLEFKKQ